MKLCIHLTLHLSSRYTYTFRQSHLPNQKMASISLIRFSPKPQNHLFSTLTPPLPKSHLFKSPIKPHKARMSYNPSPTPAPQRLISALTYTLPFFNSLQYGRFLFTQYPSLSLLFQPLLPFLSFYRSIPYASFVAFFGVYLGLVRNQSFSRYVRFNAMQAITLDVLLVVPLLLTRIFNPGRGGLGFKVLVWGHNLVFVFSCFCFVYGLVSCVLGKTPYLPFVADAAGRQI